MLIARKSLLVAMVWFLKSRPAFRLRSAVPIAARCRRFLRLDRTLDAKIVTLGRVRPDASAFRVKYEPANRPRTPPARQYPNVNP